ncbi:hypothetical protein RhiirA1_528808 [Rhizophagus irregularis]|uniref:Uncharacterized protein n=1 Tax=Rhizophagus irregularis TaxID=588596 RepID=A0A2I1EAW6_9GLOM|nr:hypothetical protein RhiirA1_528808 [Rhizophagus irregularis]PKY19262.1 hypothetical protein RhiirB3_523385 [Rhizophagus irregularis]
MNKSIEEKDKKIALSKELIQETKKTLTSAEKSINMLENKNQILEDIISAKEEKILSLYDLFTSFVPSQALDSTIEPKTYSNAYERDSCVTQELYIPSRNSPRSNRERDKTIEKIHIFAKSKGYRDSSGATKGRKLDKERFTTIHVHKKFNVPNWGRDKSLITRNIQFNKRKVITIHFDSDSEDDCNENTEDNKENIQNNLNFKELEYREKNFALKERKIALREWEAKVRLMKFKKGLKEHDLAKK